MNQEIFNAKLESIKAQLEDLTKELEANYKREKPVIEVGKVYKTKFNSLYFVTKIEDNFAFGYGFEEGKYWREKNTNLCGIEQITEEATQEEWEKALTKYFDKYYEGVEKVDRSGLDFYKNLVGITYLDNNSNGDSNSFDTYGFFYKRTYVMDKHGNIAKPVKDEVKENYSREELINKIQEYREFAWKNGLSQFSCNQWIKENTN